jgi:hypothetical protein
MAGVVHAESGLLPVWDIESPVFNALGGSYNAYGADGCAVPQRTPFVHRGPGGHALKITYNNSNGASCGIWIHLFKEGAPAGSADLPDMTRFPYLSFWIKEGGKPQDVDVRMADAVWLTRDDSKIAGRTSLYLGRPSGDGWREVVVPYRDFRLPSSRAAVIALQFAPHASGILYIDDICFKRAADLQPGYSKTPTPASDVMRQRGMWLWETTEVLKNSDREHEAFAILRDTHVTDLFLQIPHPKGEYSTQVELKPELRRFIGTAHANRIRVYALDGFPEFSLREHHEIVLSTVRNIIAFNSSGPPEDRFDGIRLDNEPYQLLGFEGPSRDEILREYLELNEKVAALLHNEAHGLAFGLDIPFWWDATGDRENPCCLVKFNGVSKSAAHHVIDLADNVCIMAYRNFAGGLDGIVNHARGDVDYAGERGKQAFVGIETFRSPPTNVVFVAAIKESQWQSLPAQSSLLRLSQFEGYPLRSFTDGVHRYIGLADKREPTAQTTFAKAVGHLRGSLPGQSSDWISDLHGFQGSVERYGRTSGEWRGVSISPLDKFNAPGGFGFSVIQNMPAKITLANKTRGFVDEILREVDEAFGQDPGFTGDAIHSLESYEELRIK